MYSQQWGGIGYELYGKCVPPPIEAPQLPPIMNGMDVKRRDHAANVTVKLPFGAKPDVWQLVKKLFRFCGQGWFWMQNAWMHCVPR